jgi:hypothetical protein
MVNQQDGVVLHQMFVIHVKMDIMGPHVNIITIVIMVFLTLQMVFVIVIITILEQIVVYFATPRHVIRIVNVISPMVFVNVRMDTPEMIVIHVIMVIIKIAIIVKNVIVMKMRFVHKMVLVIVK